jgi:SAM-dependent methyltransferase
MPTLDWLRKEFHYGYDSGDILRLFPDKVRKSEEDKIGGSYRKVFKKAILPYIKKNSRVLELGPGKGSWTRAILKYLPEGELTTIDFQDLNKFLQPEKYNGRLKTVQVSSSDYSALPDNYFDFFWSMGVLCHNNKDNIFEILKSAYSKVKPGGYSAHQYGDWEKLGKYTWEKGGVPAEFRDKKDDEIWWPRNTQQDMKAIAERAGWTVVTTDLGIVQRDSIILLRKDK